jgi:hypothetical protein
MDGWMEVETTKRKADSMTTSPRFVTVTNNSDKIITLYPDLPRTKNDDQPIEIKIAPREKSRPLPYDLLSGTKDWQALISGGRILVEDVPPWRPTLVNIKNLSSQLVSFEVKLPHPKKREPSNTSSEAFGLKPTRCSTIAPPRGSVASGTDDPRISTDMNGAPCAQFLDPI